MEVMPFFLENPTQDGDLPRMPGGQIIKYLLSGVTLQIKPYSIPFWLWAPLNPQLFV